MPISSIFQKFLHAALCRKQSPAAILKLFHECRIWLWFQVTAVKSVLETVVNDVDSIPIV